MRDDEVSGAPMPACPASAHGRSPEDNRCPASSWPDHRHRSMLTERSQTCVPGGGTMKFFPCIAALAATLLSPAYVVAQGTAEQQNACMNDAFAHCGDYIPDATKIEACLRQKIKIISPACANQFKPARQRVRAQPAQENSAPDRYRPY